MKKLFIAALFGFAVIAAGCSCKSEACTTDADANNPACDRCVTEYCELIGTKVNDPDVRAGKEKKFDDGVVIRTYPKSKITKW